MKKITRKFITFDCPGSFFPESVTQEVDSFDIPKKLPRDCYAFRFHETEFVMDGKKEYEGKTKRDKRHFLVGEIVPFDQLPEEGAIRSNVEFNSPTKEGVKCRTGNWQMVMENFIVLPESDFELTDPVVYKNWK